MEEIRNKSEKHVDIAKEFFSGNIIVNHILCVKKFLYHWCSS